MIPSVLAWGAVIMPFNTGMGALGVQLAACYLVDRRLYPHYALQSWLPLPLRLTVVAVLSCFLGASRL